MENKFLVSSSPHIRTSMSTQRIMLDVIIALVPALIVSTVFFGFRSLAHVIVAVGSAVGVEALYQKLMKKPVAVFDLSAVVTGVLLAMNLPVSTPYWMTCLGAVFAIIVAKQIFGGLGKNIFNPALAGRAFLLSWAGLMTIYTLPSLLHENWLPVLSVSVPQQTLDAVSSATTLSLIKQGLQPSVSVLDSLVGFTGGTLGETSALALLAGLIYLVYRKVITLRIPLTFIGTVALLSFIFPQGGLGHVEYLQYAVLSGGLMLGAVFMATDYTTAPITPIGQAIYGVGCGLLTVFIRFFGSYAEGVCFAILIMNVLSPIIEKYTAPKYTVVKAVAAESAPRAETQPKRLDVPMERELEDLEKEADVMKNFGIKHSKESSHLTEYLSVGLKLAVIGVVTTALLALTYAVTKDKIAENERIAMESAMKTVMPLCVSFDEAAGDYSGDVNNVYRIYDEENNYLGICVSVSPAGFGGPVNMMVGISPEGTVVGAEIVTMSETPGIGDKISNDESFRSQFIGRGGSVAYNAPGVSDKIAVDGISGATYSSKAYISGVDQALNVFARGGFDK